MPRFISTFVYTSGSGSLALPANTKRLLVECWGASGGGTGGLGTGGGGGGGGAYARTLLSLDGGTVFYNVGAGGAAGAGGGNTWVALSNSEAASFCKANGGLPAVGQTGGVGGRTADSIGNTVFAGGTGGAGGASSGGGGGGCAGHGGAGTAGAAAGGGPNFGLGGSRGAIGVNTTEVDFSLSASANGANGNSSGLAAQNGLAPGGGGGGGGASAAGGTGANGMIRITYNNKIEFVTST